MTSQPSRRGEPEPPDPLPIGVVDNHTHLDISREGAPVNLDDLEPVLRAAAAVGVDRVVQVGCDPVGNDFAVAAAARYPSVLAGVAVHPNEAPPLAARGELEDALAQVERLAAHPRVRVVGETGLDHFRTGPQGHAVQEESFRRHIEIAERAGRALQIHDRDAHEDVLRVLAEEGAPPRTVMHCFSGGPAMARECVRRGYHLSFSGTVTFKNAKELRDSLAVTPLELVLVETDAPYLTPHPWRGAANSPMLVPLTVRVMASVLGVAVPTLCEALSANAERLYGPW
ncbi:TatD family hydrolase [Phycicoccus endophyticus]|uniref:TatD family hydrolase n=1 Tax=Phycicoccus endophyticus TaxID=1690220 RepID=A0A7G9R2D2_9MICO|nr:TatD family hydrolase [Phycicoccus endophyticus]NHI20863.1 TatD family hydrolase [Phycicoccus endophyticus]QNN49757.1 TatD family hydrolase [Phycicoccus endophyticus]